MALFAELKRRNVFKVAAAYIIVGWLLLQVSDTLVPALRLPEWFHSGVAFILLIGFPIAVIFAWAFELTPEGLKREKEVDPDQSITQATGQKLNYAIMALLALAVGYFAFDKFVLDPRRDAELVQAAQERADPPAGERVADHSIAVLPLADMSPRGDHAYFSDGLTEELLNILAKIKELRVAGRTSSFAFKGKDEDLRSIAQKLNVGSILEGSVRKDDQRNRVRITLQLIDAGDGYHLWSETYDRDLDDIFAIQEDIAREVARALRVTLLGEEGDQLPQAVNTEFSAYDLYLKGLQGINEGGFESMESSVDYFQQALSIDPGYAPAKLGLVNAWAELANTGAISVSEALGRGLPLLESVLQEDPDNSFAHVLLGMLRDGEQNGSAAEAAFQKALEIDPRNARGLQEYGRLVFDGGEHDRGLAMIGAALEIDPYSVRALWDTCQGNAFLQNTDAALPACDRIRELQPNSPLGYYGRALVYHYTGDVPRTIEGYLEAIERDPGDYEMLAGVSLFWTALGDTSQAQQWLRRADAIGAGQPIPLVARIKLLQFQEQHELAGDIAGKALAEGLEDRHGSNELLRHVVAFSRVREGRFAEALQPYREASSWAFETPLVIPEDGTADYDEMILLAGLMRRVDPVSQRWETLLATAEEHLHDHYPGTGVWWPDVRMAAIATVRGDHSAAVEFLERVRKQGMRVYWRTNIVWDPIFHQLRDEPAYRDLLARFEEDLARQRETAHELLGVSR